MSRTRERFQMRDDVDVLPEFVDTRGAAIMTSHGMSTLKAMRADKRGPAHRITPTGRVLYAVSELRDYINQGAVSTSDQLHTVRRDRTRTKA